MDSKKLKHYMNILIAGGSGYIGTRLTQLLLKAGHSVGILTRQSSNSKPTKDVKYFVWDINKQQIDPQAFEFAEGIINLSGASIAGKRWDEEYKKEILNSRINSTKLIVDSINNGKFKKVKKLINASAIGYYGFDDPKEATEDSPAGKDFLADVCVAWENEVHKLNPEIASAVIIRIGIVLSLKEGALAEIIKPMKFGLGAPLGTGNQLTAWIHPDDLCNMMIWAMTNPSINGVFNGASIHPVTNKVLTQLTAKVFGYPLFLPPVPAFMLKIIVGEFVTSVVGSIDCNGKKAQNLGFDFKFKMVKEALENLKEINL